MLCVTRKTGERIFVTVPGLAAPIVITLCGISADAKRAKIGVHAERGVRIDREEIHELRKHDETMKGR